MEHPRVAIVIVNYRGREDTRECLRSLQGLTYPWYAVYVVDQASGDKTPEMVRAEFPGVQVIENRENTGFAGGNNVAIKVALVEHADYVFLLNNDTTVAPDLLDALVARAEQEPDVGIVGPMMLYYDQPEVIWATGGGVDGRGQSRLLHEGRAVSDPEANVPRPVDFVVGCGMLVKRAVCEQIGLLDEQFFLYYEESDFCARAQKAGWKIVYEPSGRLWHKISRSTGSDSPRTLYYMRRNQLLYLERHGVKAGQAVALADALRLLLVWTLQRAPCEKRRALWKAIADYGRRRFGKAEI